MKSRLKVVSKIFTILVSVVVIRLLFLQVWQHKIYVEKAKKNSVLNIKKFPLRAEIHDRHGNVLANSNPSFKIIFYCSNKEAEYIKNIIKEYGFQDSKIEYGTLIFENLSWNDLASILQICSIPMPEIEIMQKRIYPHKDLVAHLIGYVFKNGDQVLCGKMGVEKLFEKSLQGLSGKDSFLINARRKKLLKFESILPKQADPVCISIDLELQKFTFDILSQFQNGACLVVNIESGEILAATQFPSFDPQAFVDSDQKKINTYYRSKFKPLFNLVFNGTFPPGSLMKPFAVIAALKQGVATECNCTKEFFIGTKRFRCWKKHGTLSLPRVLAESCDIPFYSWSLKLNESTLRNCWKIFGFSEPILPELNVKNGYLPKHKNNWKSVDSLFMQIGQGETALTLAALTQAFARLASGKEVKLSIKKLSEKPKFKKLRIDEKHLNIVRLGLLEATNTPGGTAFGVFENAIKLEIAGKTGTSQVRKLREHEYGKGNDFKLWEDRDHALFCAFAPAGTPKVAACIIIVHGGSGGRTAAAPLMKILEKALSLNK